MSEKTLFAQVFDEKSELFKVECSDEMNNSTSDMSHQIEWHYSSDSKQRIVKIDLTRHSQKIAEFFLSPETYADGEEYLEIQNSWEGYVSESGSDASIDISTGSTEDYIQSVADSDDMERYTAEVSSRYSQGVEHLMLTRAAEITQAWQNDIRLQTMLAGNKMEHLYDANFGVLSPKGYFSDMLIHVGRTAWTSSAPGSLLKNNTLVPYTNHPKDGDLLIFSDEKDPDSQAVLPVFMYSYTPLGFRFEIEQTYGGKILMFSIWEKNSDEDGYKSIDKYELEERIAEL